MTLRYEVSPIGGEARELRRRNKKRPENFGRNSQIRNLSKVQEGIALSVEQISVIITPEEEIAMAESIKVQVPLTGEHVTPHGEAPPQQQPERVSGFKDGVYQPPEGRQPLHKLRMPRQADQTQTEPVWTGNRFEWKPVERAEPPQATAPPPQSAPANDAVSRQISQLTDVVALMAQKQGLIPEDTGPRMPDPARFDFYDPQDEAEYHRMHKEYVDAVVQQRMQAEIDPYRPMLADAQKAHDMQSQFNECVAEHGKDPNFNRVMSAALELVADSNNKLSITEAYAQADNPDNARPGVRGNSHLPKHLTQGKFPRFGEILLHNQMSGRSRR